MMPAIPFHSMFDDPWMVVMMMNLLSSHRTITCGNSNVPNNNKHHHHRCSSSPSLNLLQQQRFRSNHHHYSARRRWRPPQQRQQLGWFSTMFPTVEVLMQVAVLVRVTFLLISIPEKNTVVLAWLYVPTRIQKPPFHHRSFRKWEWYGDCRSMNRPNDATNNMDMIRRYNSYYYYYSNHHHIVPFSKVRTICHQTVKKKDDTDASFDFDDTCQYPSESNSNNQNRSSSRTHNNQKGGKSVVSPVYTASMDTALAVVPPDEAWDRIQRARHMAKDSTYDRWPPAIRFFHPFVSADQLHNVALDIASIIEQYDVASFQVTLSQWSIIPHMERMDIVMDPARLDTTPSSSSSSSTWDDSPKSIQSMEDQKIQALINNEERIGKEKMKLRQQKQQLLRQKNETVANTNLDDSNATDDDDENNNNDDATQNGTVPTKKVKRYTTASSSKSRTAHEQQLLQGALYNGPCVICLEPDVASRDKLQAVRYLLKHTLLSSSSSYDNKNIANLYSPTSSVTTTTRTNIIPSTDRSTVASSSRRIPPPAAAAQQHPLRSRNKKLRTIRQFEQRLRSMYDVEEEDDPSDYRPVVPIAAFDTVSSAIRVARQLRQLWEPLTFNVTDLHLLSSSSHEQQQPYDVNQNQDTNTSRPATSSSSSSSPRTPTHHDSRYQNPEMNIRKPPVHTSQPPPQSNSVHDIQQQQRGSRHHHNGDGTFEQFGCDALVSLMGVEPMEDMEDDHLDPVNTQDIIQMVCEMGEPGGYYKNITDRTDPNHTRPPDLTEQQDDMNTTTELERWLLEEDEEYDAGTVVVIGRTQLFTGEMRTYVGMPACSVLDGRDKAHGESYVSGAARRRTTVHRSGSLYDDGDWGQKQIDYEPWGMRERTKRNKNKTITEIE
jgi:hypothetical protein